GCYRGGSACCRFVIAGGSDHAAHEILWCVPDLVVACDRHADSRTLPRLQLKGVGRYILMQAGGRGVKAEACGPYLIVETPIHHLHAPRRVEACFRFAAPASMQPANLEQIGKIVIEGERQAEFYRGVAVITDIQPVVGAALPKKQRAHNMN